ncbi:MAG: hypothetical protein JSU07_12325 [Bacteroidetes bacterium]|nr:hypothetical protein [Bacteroidota bacterium]
MLAKFIIVPLLKLYKIGPIISYEFAAQIIGKHFNSVEDKLLNLLQLQNSLTLNHSNDLLLAGIHQKTMQLSPIPFTSAINLNENKKYIKYVLPPLFVFLLIYILWPQVILKSSKRLMHYSTYYAKELPFQFKIKNKQLQTLQTNDFDLMVLIDGNTLPNEVFININNIDYKLEKVSKTEFKYTFKNLQHTTEFVLNAAGYNSEPYELKVLSKPLLEQFSLTFIYPVYLNKPSETINNTGDIQIPQGTKVIWKFNTKNTSNFYMSFTDSLAHVKKASNNLFTYTRIFKAGNAYTIKPLNENNVQHPDSVSYGINVILDQYPIISAEQKNDSLNNLNIYYSGQIKDDYGFSKLQYFYKILYTDTLGNEKEKQGTEQISLSKQQTTQTFFYFFDATKYSLKSGDKLEYYFEVFDNDGVNGAKSSKTQTYKYSAPTKNEIAEATQKNNSEIKKDLEESISKAKQLQKDISDLSKKMNEKKQLGYEEKKKLDEMLKKQNELRQKIEQIKQDNLQNNKQQNQFSQNDQSILDKQQELEKLFENIMTPEMKKMFDELNKLMERLDKNEIQQKLEDLKLSNKDIEKELDRNLEAFKQLEVEQKMQSALDKLNELKNKQDKLNELTENKKKDDAQLNNQTKDEKTKDSKNEGQKNNEKSPNDLKNEKQPDKNNESKNQDNNKNTSKQLEQKQNELNREFEKLKEDLKDIENKNSQLESPNQLPDTKQLQNEINQSMQNASQQLSKNNKKSAGKEQKNASEKMEQMQQQMEESMSENEEQQDELNEKSLRQILKNLLNVSYGQENLIIQLPKTNIDNPQYVNIPKDQKKLKDDSKMIEDSLLSLSKRIPAISAQVNREINSINMNMAKTVSSLAERNTGESLMRMQSSMTSVNKLALLLNEILDQLQKEQQQKQQQKQQSGKKGKCKKPGSGQGSKPSDKPSIQSMRQMQEQLNKQLQQLKDALDKKGQKPGEKPNGQKPGQQQGGSGINMLPGNSQQLAQMAAQQEAIRRQIEALTEKLKNKGSKPGGNMADLMEQTEKDIVNRSISNETMKRQQEILTRLLESEKAEKERDQDEQRKSNEAKNENLSNPNQFLEYKRLKEKELELLQTVPPNLTPYYREKVNNYLNNTIKAK